MAHLKGMTRWLAYARAAVLALMVPATQAAGQADMLEARILPGWRAADGVHVAALHISMDEGWKTYWRAPGDAGIPPVFDWRGSRNLSDVRVEWPTPERFLQSGISSIGYSDSLVLPLRLKPASPGQTIALNGRIEIGVCREICVPVTLSLSQALPAQRTKPDPRIVAALAERPYSAKEAGVQRVACRIRPIEDGFRLHAEVSMRRHADGEVVIVETGDPGIWASQARTSRKGDVIVAESDLYHVEGRVFAVDRSDLRITVLGDKYAVDIQGCPSG